MRARTLGTRLIKVVLEWISHILIDWPTWRHVVWSVIEVLASTDYSSIDWENSWYFLGERLNGIVMGFYVGWKEKITHVGSHRLGRCHRPSTTGTPPNDLLETNAPTYIVLETTDFFLH
jgi:hypothetical protein